MPKAVRFAWHYKEHILLLTAAALLLNVILLYEYIYISKHNGQFPKMMILALIFFIFSFVSDDMEYENNDIN